MRQFITLSAHIMNHNDQFVNFWKYHQQAKTISEQNISNLLQTKLQSPTELFKWYKKKNQNPFF